MGNNESSKGKGSCLIIIVICVIFGGIGCCYNREFNKINNANLQQIQKLKNELDAQNKELQSLARICGIPESKIESSSPSSLISDIQIKLDSMQYLGNTLSDEDMSFLNDLLSPEPKIKNTVKNYDAFIKGLKNGD